MPKRKNEAASSAGASRGRGAWKLLDTASVLLGAFLAPRVSQIAWRTVSGKRPPRSSAHPEVSTKEAIAWAAIGGAIVQIVRVLSRRAVATYWVRSTGDLPPGMKHLASPETTKKKK